MISTVYSQMQDGLQQMLEFSEIINKKAIIEKNKEIQYTKIFDSFNPEKLIQRPTQKKENTQFNQYEIRSLIKQQPQKDPTHRSLNSVRQANYYLNLNQQKHNETDIKKQLISDQKFITDESSIQPHNTTFIPEFSYNVSPQKQLNYRSITPGRQVIRHVELESPKNEQLFTLSYKLKNQKIIQIHVRRNDNLIKIAHQSAVKYKLDHNAYLQILRSLKEKYNNCLENQWTNRKK